MSFSDLVAAVLKINIQCLTHAQEIAGGHDLCFFVIVLDDLSDELENESINSSMGYFLSLQASLLATNYFSPSSTDFFSFS